MFLVELNKHKQLVISEVLLKNYNSPILSEEYKELNNEIFIPFKNNDFKKSANIYHTSPIRKEVRRCFIPNTEWIYYKIYIRDNFYVKFSLMLNVKLKLLLLKNKIAGFFYIMFSDPDFHIRLRLHINKEDYNFINNEISILIDRLINEKYIRDISLNTYVRELERYSSNNIEIIEEIFCVDSAISLNMVNMCHKINLEYWIFSVKMSLIYIDVVFSKLEDKISFVKNNREKLNYFLSENNQNDTNWINQKYQENIDKIEKYITDDSFIKNSDINKIKKLINKIDTNQYTLPYYIENIIHMHITRVVSSKELIKVASIPTGSLSVWLFKPSIITLVCDSRSANEVFGFAILIRIFKC